MNDFVLLDGRLASTIRLERLKAQITRAIQKYGRAPCLSVIRVGDDTASKIYVSKKLATCKVMGIDSQEIHLSESVSSHQVASEIQKLNDDSSVDGILLQLPLPKQLDANSLIEKMLPEKEVDGFHPFNLGRFIAGRSTFVGCTALGIIHLLDHYKIEIAGKRAVVMGRSLIVGRPTSLLLDQRGATVTVVHLATQNPTEITREADILIVATGVKHLVGSDHVKAGAIVVDVGIHRQENGKLCGDVDFEAVKSKVRAITPVPGGVGPMTICSLLENTFTSYQQRMGP